MALEFAQDRLAVVASTAQYLVGENSAKRVKLAVTVTPKIHHDQKFLLVLGHWRHI